MSSISLPAASYAMGLSGVNFHDLQPEVYKYYPEFREKAMVFQKQRAELLYS